MKKSFVIRIDEDVYKLLEKWAQDEFRSVNGQIDYIIHNSLQKAGRMKKSKQSPPKNEKDSADES